MNERIRELTEQAAEYAAQNATGDWEVGPDYQDIFNKKFAQLIVAKCVAQCEFVAGQAEITNKGEMARKTKATADYCAFFIKEYFGVEE
jgi:hypothetical protein